MVTAVLSAGCSNYGRGLSNCQLSLWEAYYQIGWWLLLQSHHFGFTEIFSQKHDKVIDGCKTEWNGFSLIVYLFNRSSTSLSYCVKRTGRTGARRWRFCRKKTNKKTWTLPSSLDTESCMIEFCIYNIELHLKSRRKFFFYKACKVTLAIT